MRRIFTCFLFALICAATASKGQLTIMLKPDSCEGKDVLLGDCIPCGYDTTNFGSATDLISIAWTNGGNPSNARSMLEFNLSQIPAGSVVVSAYLSLYHNPTSTTNAGHSQLSGSNASFLRRITSSWSENAVTWNTQPATTTQNEVLLPASTSNTQDYPNIDVTALVQDMINNPLQSHGFMLQLQTESYYRSLLFASSDHTNPALHPSLEVTYLPATGQICTVIQPGNTFCSDGKDALIADCVPCGYANSNFGTATDFIAIAWTNGGNPSNARGLLEFDLSQIPSGSLINSAFLSLYHNSTSTTNAGHSQLSGSNASVLRRILDPWTESTVTWNTQPSATTQNEVLLPPSTSNTQDYLNIDVSGLVQDMVNNPSQSFGFLLQLQTESYYRSLLFASSDHADPLKHPRLEVCYTLPTGISEVTSSDPFAIFPNPAQTGQYVMIVSPGTGTFIEIFDLLGKRVFTSKLYAERQAIVLQNLTTGMYSMKMTYNNISSVKPLIVTP